MKQNIRTYLGIFAAFLFAVSCMDDLGNYIYSDVNMLTVEGVESSYIVNQYSNIDPITPNISQSITKGDENLEYYWILEDDTLSTNKTLDVEIRKAPGSYFMYLYVYDINTDIYSKMSTKLNVMSATGRGAMVLSNKDGQASLSYFYNDYTARIDKIEDDIDGGIGENPVKVNYHFKGGFGARAFPAAISVFCQDSRGGVVLDGVSFDKYKDYGDMFMIKNESPMPQDFVRQYEVYKFLNTYGSSYTGNTYRQIIIDNGNVHEQFTYNQGMNEQFSPKITSPDDNGYYIAGIAPHSGAAAIMYDSKNGRVIGRNHTSSNKLRLVTITSSLPQFNPAAIDTSLELELFDIGYSVGSYPSYYMVFSNEDKAFVASFTADYYYKLTVGSYAEVPVTVDENTKYALHLYTPTLYFSHSGNKIASISTATGNMSEAYSGFPADSKITYMKVNPSIIVNENGQNVFSQAVLWVGTLNSDGNSTFYVFEVGYDNVLTKLHQFDDVNGNIVSVAYKY